MSHPQRPSEYTPRIAAPVEALVSECRDYLDWEELRLSSILKRLHDRTTVGTDSPFEAADDGVLWDPATGNFRRERLMTLISTVCGIMPSQSELTTLMGRLPTREAAILQERRNTVRCLAQAVHSAARGWMRQVALLELGVECTLQELTGGRSFSVSYDDQGLISTASHQPLINFRT